MEDSQINNLLTTTNSLCRKKIIPDKLIIEIAKVLMEEGIKEIGKKDLEKINEKLLEWADEGDKEARGQESDFKNIKKFFRSPRTKVRGLSETFGCSRLHSSPH